MKILFAPDYGDNDYQNSLKEELVKLDVKIYSTSKSIFFPILFSFFKIRPKIIHFHWTGPYLFGTNIFFTFVKSFIFISEVFICRLLGAGIVWTVHNLYNHEKYHKNLEIFFNNLLVYLSDKLIVHSNLQKEKIKQFYGKKAYLKTSVIFEGGYDRLYGFKIDRYSACNILKINPDYINILFYGNIREYKGLELLVEAFNSAYENKNLLILGKCFDDNIKKRLEDKISNIPNILFKFKHASCEDTVFFFSACDAVVLPYTDIFNSGLISLAISMEKPVIYSDLDLLKENLDGCGISFIKGDISDLNKVIKSLKRKDLDVFLPKIRERKTIFSWKNNAKNLLYIYEKISYGQ
ncbi:MAG: glycosyltransferase family 4 protein [Elusimicrobiota bacterium]